MDIEKLSDCALVRPGKRVSLRKDFDPDYKPDDIDKKQSESLLRFSVEELARLQDKLYAQNTHALLVIFQAMDAAGKDGAIKHVMSGLNPQGCQVFSFKAPSSEELDHGYLWRCFKALPERGRVGIFNRSYYEEVLAVRVHPELLERQHIPRELKDDDIWERRYDEINGFEKYLTNNGTSVVKIFLHISREEQRQRFLERLDRPEKNWKFSLADVKQREFWDDYMSA
ncbi:MAG: PPK2 family polyphosphate kinase, partial [Bryobacteraceae bacterium]